MKNFSLLVIASILLIFLLSSNKKFTIIGLQIASPIHLARQPIPFTTAQFGGIYVSNSCSDFKEVVLAHPIEACGDLYDPDYIITTRIDDNNTKEIINKTASDMKFKDKIVLVVRGKCTFTTKAEQVQKVGASGMIVMNSDGGEMYAMSDDGSYASYFIRIKSVLIPYANGISLISHINEYNEYLKQHDEGEFVPPLLASLGYCQSLDYDYF
ncbi:hypothetical protein ABK040_003414 [Willaertia magna]